MTETEAIDFLSDLAFVAFPSVRQWLLTTDKYNATIRMMAKTLSDIDRDEADAVIDSWITGRVEAPKYLRDGFVLHIRACAMARRQQEIAERQLRDEQAKEIMPGVHVFNQIRGCGLWTGEWLPIKAAFDAGQITRDDALAYWHAKLDEAFQRPVRGYITTEPGNDH